MQEPSRGFSNSKTLVFMLVLSFVAAFVLSVLASALSVPQEEAKELDRSKEMLVAARIYNNETHSFQVEQNGAYVPAKFVDGARLEPTKEIRSPTSSEILAVVRKRVEHILIDNQGNTTTFEREKLDIHQYITKNKKKGYADLPYKLAYKILPNPDVNGTQEGPVEGYIIPVAGFGLWDYIYGYIAIKPDGDTVIGISWYEQKETPGLGANIADPPWQSQFPGKKIFQPDSMGETDFTRGPLGIFVVRGKVKEVVGSSPKAIACVDGMAGATLTGNGVTKAYKDTLGPYRPFFIKLRQISGTGSK